MRRHVLWGRGGGGGNRAGRLTSQPALGRERDSDSNSNSHGGKQLFIYPAYSVDFGEYTFYSSLNHFYVLEFMFYPITEFYLFVFCPVLSCLTTSSKCAFLKD